MARNGIYSGYVIDNSLTNPVTVWCPSLVPVPSIMGAIRTFGDNLFNAIGPAELATLRTICASNENKFYMTMELTSGANCNANYYENYGKTTTNSFLSDAKFPNMETGENLAQKGCSAYSNMPALKNPFTNPSYLGLPCDAILDTVEGIKPDNLENAPKGNWTKLAVGTRVIVAYIDDGSTGVVLRQFPFPDEHTKTLLQQAK